MQVGRPRREHATVPQHLGTALAARRQAAGLSRTALADAAGVSVNTLMKVEQGQTQDPGVLKVAALCRALTMSVDMLVEESEGTQHAHAQDRAPGGILSIGYEGRTIDGFLAELQRAGVQTVVDVRLNAISRKAGFSKTRLGMALEARGIGYLHLRNLGNAKDNREPFRTGRVMEGRRVFRERLRTPEAISSLQELTQLASRGVVAVLCFEADAETCHRKVVIDAVARSAGVSTSAARS